MHKKIKNLTFYFFYYTISTLLKVLKSVFYFLFFNYIYLWRKLCMKKSLKKAKGKENKKDSSELQKLSSEETKDVSGGAVMRKNSQLR